MTRRLPSVTNILGGVRFYLAILCYALLIVPSVYFLASYVGGGG